MLPFEYDKLEIHSNGQIAVAQNGKMRLIDFLTGKTILDSDYESIDKNDNFWKVQRNGLYNIVSNNNKPLFEEWYNNISQRYIFYIINKNNKYGIANLNGEIILTPQYQSLSINRIGVQYCAMVTENGKGKYGSLDADKKTVIPFEYDDLRPFRLTYIITSKASKYGVCTAADGKMLVPFNYDFIIEIQDKSLLGYTKAKGFEKIDL